MKRSVSLLILMIVITILFSSCDLLSFKAAENLIRPPKLEGSNGELQVAFENAVKDKGEIILRYPSSGNYRSAYVRYDCDNDGNDEAFVFYSLKTEEMSVYMYMLDQSDGEWRALGDLKGDGSDIYAIEFCDLNNDGVAEILAGWSSLDSKNNKTLSVYSSFRNSQNLNYKPIAMETYTAMHTVDLDEDGENEVFLALIDSNSDTYTTEAYLLKMQKKNETESTIAAVGQISLYEEVTGFSAINSGYADGKKYVYLDEVADSTYLTEMIHWDKETKNLVAPFKTDKLNVSSCPTSRSMPITSSDIDGDGEIEIPVTQLLPDSSIIKTSESEAENGITHTSSVYITKWCRFDNGEFTSVKQYIKNDGDGYSFRYKDDEMDGISVLIYSDEHRSEFFVTEKPENEDEEPIKTVYFTVSAVEPDKTVSVSSYLATGEKYKYIYEITEQGEQAGYTREKILANFVIDEP